MSGEAVVPATASRRYAVSGMGQIARTIRFPGAVAAGLGVVLVAATVGALVWRSRGSLVSSNTLGPTASLNEPVGAYELTRQAAALLARQDKEGNVDRAIALLERALSDDKTSASASTYTNLGTLRFFQGRYSDAAGAFEKAVELGANNHLFWGNLGDGYRWAPGRRSDAPAAYRRASELLQQQIAKKPQDPDLRTRHALYLMKMGDRPAALKEIERVADSPSLTSQMLYRLAVVYELAGDRPRALSALDRALKAGYPVKELDNEPD